MKTVTFPLLNLELKLNPVAFNIFGMDIHWYAIFIVASFILALILCKKKDGKFGIHYGDILDLSLILIPISFLCARIYYIVFNLDYYNSFYRIINIKDGGLAIYGGIIGGIISIVLFCKNRKISLLDITDYIVPYLALGQSIGRWGNFINVEAYGTITNMPWKMGIESANEIVYVHPTFLYESISTFIIFLVLNQISKNRKFRGQITWIYLICYSFIRAIIEVLRTDSLMFAGFRVSQIVSIIVFLSSLCFLYVLKKRQK